MSAGDMQDEQVKEALITYEKLQAIEDDFEDVELEIRKSILGCLASQKLY
jgi:hypothetical protein